MGENLYFKLAAIQSELKAPKSQYNSFGKYHYRKCEDILEAVKPLLEKFKCCLILSDEVVLIGERYYIKATATLHDAELAGSISAVAFAREEEKKAGMDGSQISGSSSSYSRKYALNGLFAIDDTADSDTTNVGQNTPHNRTQNARTQNTSAKAQTSKERKGNALSDEQYWATVGAYAEGKTLNGGGDIRDWFIQHTNASEEAIARFDADVDNYRAAHI